MNMAYLLQVHQNFEQLIELIKKLREYKTEKIFIFIHVDSKNKKLKNRLKEYYLNNNFIFILEESISVNWGGLSQVLATIEGLKVIKSTKVEFKYIHFISGQDYPLKSSEEIYNFFYNTTNDFLEFRDIGDFYWRIKFYSFFNENKLNRTILFRSINKIIRVFLKIFNFERKNLNGIKLYKGSSWFSLKSETCFYCLKEIEDKKILEEYKWTLCSDEHIFQNIICNSKLKKNVINNNLRYIEWDGKNSPKTFIKEDIKKYSEIPNKLFIRKIKFQENKEK